MTRVLPTFADLSPAGPHGDHQHEHACCPAGPGRPQRARLPATSWPGYGEGRCFCFENIFFFKIFIYLSVPVLVAARGIFSCGLWDLFP